MLRKVEVAEAGRGCADRGAAGERVHDARRRSPDANRPTASSSRRRKSCRATAIIVARRRPTNRLAAQSPGELRDRFLLRAAREYVRGDQIEQASALLKQVSTTLPSADFALRAQVAAELASADSASRQEHWRSSIAFRSRCRAKMLPTSRAARARAVRAESPRGGRHDCAGARARADQPGRSARQSTADLARPAAERRRQCGFHRAARRERDGHRLARSRSRRFGCRAQSVHRERRSRRLAQPLPVASGELAAERRSAARARRRPGISARRSR